MKEKNKRDSISFGDNNLQPYAELVTNTLVATTKFILRQISIAEPALTSQLAINLAV